MVSTSLIVAIILGTVCFFQMVIIIMLIVALIKGKKPKVAE